MAWIYEYNNQNKNNSPNHVYNIQLLVNWLILTAFPYLPTPPLGQDMT